MEKFLENWEKFLEEGDYQKELHTPSELARHDRNNLAKKGGAESSAPFTENPPKGRSKSAPPGFGGSLEEAEVEEDILFKPLSKKQKAHASKFIRVKYKNKPLDKDGIIDPKVAKDEKEESLEEKKKKKKGDRCTRIAKRKYKAWPSAYASGAVVKCRQGKIWKKEK